MTPRATCSACTRCNEPAGPSIRRLRSLRRRAFRIVLAVGLCAFLAGCLFVGLYLLEGVFARIGEPDQSLAFWYLPFLFGGLICLAGGGVLAAWAWRELRKR